MSLLNKTKNNTFYLKILNGHPLKKNQKKRKAQSKGINTYEKKKQTNKQTNK